MKIAIYCRVSKRELKPENQKLQLVEYAKQKGWDYEVFEEIESTRKTRPVKESILKLIREGKFDGVLIYKLDRWARSLQELIMNVTEITERGKQFIVSTQAFDTTSASGMLMMQILGAFAEFEREIIRERTIAGLDRARARGVKLGRPRGSSRPVIKKLPEVNRLMSLGKSDREIAEIMKTSRYRVKEAMDTIRRINLSNTGEGLILTTSG